MNETLEQVMDHIWDEEYMEAQELYDKYQTDNDKSQGAIIEYLVDQHFDDKEMLKSRLLDAVGGLFLGESLAGEGEQE